MFEKNIEWCNQQLFFYKDKLYNSNSSLDLTVTTNTEDYKSFSLPYLNIIIINHNDRTRRSCGLSLYHISDILSSFKPTLSNIDESYNNSVQIAKRIGDQEISFAFKSSRSGDRCIVTRIVRNESDFGFVIVPLYIFYSVIEIFENYRLNYSNVIFNLQTTFLLKQVLSYSKSIENAIKTLPSSIVEIKSVDKPILLEGENNRDDIIDSGEQKMEELDKFLGDDFKNIDIPEINNISGSESSNVVDKINEDFLNGVLDNDISKIGSMMKAIAATDAPFTKFYESLKYSLKNVSGKDIELLPGINENDYKSSFYLSSLFLSSNFQRYFVLNVPIIPTMPVLKYKIENRELIKPENIELAYDLFLVSCYLRSVKSKLEDKNSDCLENKSLLYLMFRSFSDLLIFSFLDNIPKDTVKTNVLKRFDIWSKKGVFERYESELSNYNCSRVSSKDISDFIDENFDKLIQYSPFINERHESNFKSGEVRLPSINNYNLEQINEIVRVEAFEKLDIDVTNKDALSNYIDLTTISEDTLEIFKTKKIVVKDKKKEDTTNHIHRLLSFYKEEIPEEVVNPLLKYVLESKEKINLNDVSSKICDINELGDNIVKGLYLWDPEKREPYSDFYVRVENEMLTKNEIIEQSKISDKVEEENTDWSSITSLDLEL